jgi:tRNA-2-methylthio-N6-dimethylallyladenosine synthase
VGAERSRRLAGRRLEVLVDGTSRKDARQASGRTRCNRVVNFDAGGENLLGEVVSVRITEALPHSLRGELAAHGAHRLAPAGPPA